MSPRSPRRPLALRLRLALFAAGAICIAVSSGVFYWLWLQQTLARSVTELQQQVSVVASGVAVSDVLPGSDVDAGGARERLLKVEAGLLGARLAVTDAEGTVLFATAESSAPSAYPIDTLDRTGDAFAPLSGLLDFPGVGKVAVAAVPVGFTAPNTPSRYLVGARALRDLRSANRWVLASIGLGSLAGLLVAWLFGGWLAARVTRPLRRLTEGALAMSAGDWGRQVPVEGDDEVARLAGAFNTMSERVGNAYRAQQHFVADVSHELRTPVASIRGFADAIAEGVASDETTIRRSAEVISDEAQRLAELTSTLLALVDLESGAVPVVAEALDTSSLASALEDRFGHVAEAAGTTLTIEVGGGAPLGDHDRLLQAASVLVDNALVHGRRGGHVRVSMGYKGPGRWQLAVDDDGPGVPEAERERIFGRFTRLDGSRSADSGGSGLGLAICRSTVELMGGTVTAGSAEGLGGARFAIELPSADSTQTQHSPNPTTTGGGDTASAGRTSGIASDERNAS